MESRSKYDLTTYRAKLKLSGSTGKRIPEAKIRTWIANNFDFKERKGGDELLICNPFNGDSSFKMNINPEMGVVHCWTGDEWAGQINPTTKKRNCSFVKLVQKYRKCTYSEAVREILGTTEDIRSYLRPENRHSTAEPDRKIAVALPDGTERLADNVNDKQAAIVIRWLQKRGYTLEDIGKNDLYHLGVDCYWPYYEFDTLVYWQSRNRYNKVYRFPDLIVYNNKGASVGKTEGGKGDFLYGFDDCENASYVVLTESIFGKHTLGDQTLATGGAMLTAEQISKLRILGPRKGIILSPDNDKAGIKSVISNIGLLRMEGYPLFYCLPPKLPFVKNGEAKLTKDWNEILEELGASRDEVRALHDKRIKKVTTATLNELHRDLSQRC